MGDWADDRAAEWFGSITPAIPAEIRGRFVTLNMPSLAALLREVADAHCEAHREMRARVLAKVRRVVEQAASDVRLACISTTESDAVGALRGALLSRLDKL